MESEWTRRAIYDIARKRGLDRKVVKAIIMSEFEAGMNNIRNADPDSGIVPVVRLTELITFKVKPKKLEHLRGRNDYLKEQRKRSLNLKK